MERVWPGRARRAMFTVFAALFSILFLQVIFYNTRYTHYNPVWVLVCAVVWFAAVYGLYRLCERYKSWMAKREKWLLAGIFLLEALTMVFFYSQVAGWPARDFERVYQAAVNYTVNGFIEEPYLTYFYRYPNNMPLTVVLELLFRFTHRFGFDDFHTVGVVFNAGCILLGWTFVYLCCRRLFGVGKGMFALGLLWLCLPLQCYISYFYTDTVTLWCAPFGFYLYLRLRDAATWKGRALAAGILALGMAVGTKLKYSVAITLIAIGIDILLRLRWRDLLALGTACLLCFVMVYTAFDTVIYTHYLDAETSREMATPFTAWIMMGLGGDGGHNPDDNHAVWAREGAREMEAFAKEELWARLGAFTPVTFVSFMNAKALKSWGSGNLDYIHTVASIPMRETLLSESVSENGRFFGVFDTVTQGWHVMLFLLLVAGAVYAVLMRRYEMFIPVLAILGLFFFLLLWEADNRYLLNFYGMFIVAAAGSMALLPGIRRTRAGKTDLKACEANGGGEDDG